MGTYSIDDNSLKIQYGFRNKINSITPQEEGEQASEIVNEESKYQEYEFWHTINDECSTVFTVPITKGEKLGVVISTGGWHTPPLYAVFMQALEEKGVKAYTTFIPTLNVIHNDTTNEDDPAFSLPEPAEGWPTPNDDAAAIEEDIVALMNQGRKVIVIAHSNGGMAATQAAKPEYHWKARAEKGLPGGIIGILYVSAFLLPVGLSVWEVVGEAVVPPYSKLHKYGKQGLTTSIRNREFFFSGVSEAECHFYEKLMRAQPVPKSRLTNDPYKVYPLGYVQCMDDKALPIQAQEQMCSARIEEGCNMKLYREPFDHCPTVSAVDRMVEIALDFAASVK